MVALWSLNYFPNNILYLSFIFAGGLTQKFQCNLKYFLTNNLRTQYSSNTMENCVSSRNSQCEKIRRVYLRVVVFV